MMENKEQQKIEKDLNPIFNNMTEDEKAACYKIFEKLNSYNGYTINYAIGYCYGKTKKY